MAVQAIRHFRGDCVIHIGEWLGDTGDESFEIELAQVRGGVHCTFPQSFAVVNLVPWEP